MAQKYVVRNKEYYLNTLNIEADLLKKASDLAERMMVAFMRENKAEVKIDIDDIADKIVDKILIKLPLITRESSTQSRISSSDGFKYSEDDTLIVKTEKIEVKGKIAQESKTQDSISENMDALEGIKI